MEPIDHLFRRESGRMVATLTRTFGIHNLALAEDVVQDAFCRAVDVWKFRGMPENPSAWLMTTAKNRALDLLRRERRALTFAPELARLIESEASLAPAIDSFFTPHTIKDDQLRMMFSCCHPRLREEAQVSLVLHILCGFSVGEIASAFLISPAATEKRITRSKKVLAGSKRLFELSDADFTTRLSIVHRALYLLFNEGYHGACANSAVRVELCAEAMRLAEMLLDHALTATPTSYALSALLHLSAGRLPGRVDISGDLISFFDQDRALWNQEILTRGRRLLELSATGSELSDYHVEASIAAVHASAGTAEETDWGAIVSLYDTLLQVRSTPVGALNRALAVAQYKGPECGLQELNGIVDRDRLSAYPFYFAALGELELQCGRRSLAHDHFTSALALARNPMERRFLDQRVGECACNDTLQNSGVHSEVPLANE